MYVEVSIPISLFRTFTYIVPRKYSELVFIGQSVIVSFNKKKLTGFIIEINSKSTFKGKLLYLLDINTNSFILSKELLKTINWIAKYYMCPIGPVLHNTINYQHRKKFSFPKLKYLEITKNGKDAIPNIKFRAQNKILTYIKAQNKKVNLDELKFCAKSHSQVCNTLVKKGFLKITEVEDLKGVLKTKKTINTFNIKLTLEQNVVYKSILTSIKNNNKTIFLGGVPASGKTIIYSKIIEYYLATNKNIIILVPEISLVQQLYEKLKIFYKDNVGLWHSKLKQSQKDNILYNIKLKKINVLVSTRSGLFLPFNNLGLIVVDEEHESSYKQDLNAPYYNTRDVALMRGKFSRSLVILTSSSPSMETYYNVKNKSYRSYFLKNRYEKFLLPTVRLVNMCYEKGMLSQILIDKIRDRINKNEKVLLLQNKKGIDKGGIQKVEIILKKIFPAIKILRYDQDTASKKDDYYKILNRFKDGKENILLGTKMIAKGLDFENITLVSIITADIGLNLPDFRSGEKVFQLIYQCIGRAGRGNQESEAIIQSYNPDDIHIKNACSSKINESYEIILNERKELYYPPYSRLIKVLFLGKNEKSVIDKSNAFFSILDKNKKIKLLGPSLAPIEKENSFWRYQILIKCKKTYWQNFHNWYNNNSLIKEFESKCKNIKLKIDVDPVSIL